MSSSRSAEKAARQSQRRRLRNKSVHSALKSSARKAERVIAEGQLDSVDAAMLQAVTALDKAAQKGIIHKNNAARHKSRLMAKYNAVRQAAPS